MQFEFNRLGHTSHPFLVTQLRSILNGVCVLHKPQTSLCTPLILRSSFTRARKSARVCTQSIMLTRKVVSLCFIATIKRILSCSAKGSRLTEKAEMARWFPFRATLDASLLHQRYDPVHATTKELFLTARIYLIVIGILPTIVFNAVRFSRL